jgi:hypothetical protein
MLNTFWAVFLGASLGLFAVNAIQTVLDEYRANKRRKSMRLLLQDYEDFEADDEDE